MKDNKVNKKSNTNTGLDSKNYSWLSVVALGAIVYHFTNLSALQSSPKNLPLSIIALSMGLILIFVNEYVSRKLNNKYIRFFLTVLSGIYIALILQQFISMSITGRMGGMG